ncbi:hypothetical protein BSG1_09568, partial [Bacillus sp. SG-1]
QCIPFPTDISEGWAIMLATLISAVLVEFVASKRKKGETLSE